MVASTQCPSSHLQIPLYKEAPSGITGVECVPFYLCVIGELLHWACQVSDTCYLLQTLQSQFSQVTKQISKQSSEKQPFWGILIQNQCNILSERFNVQTKMITLATFIQNSFGSHSHNSQRRKRNNMNPNWKRRRKTVTICR